MWEYPFVCFCTRLMRDSARCSLRCLVSKLNETNTAFRIVAGIMSPPPKVASPPARIVSPPARVADPELGWEHSQVNITYESTPEELRGPQELTISGSQRTTHQVGQGT